MVPHRKSSLLMALRQRMGDGVINLKVRQLVHAKGLTREMRVGPFACMELGEGAWHGMIFTGLLLRQLRHGGDGGIYFFFCVEHREAEPHRALLDSAQRFMHPWRAVRAGASGNAVIGRQHV